MYRLYIYIQIDFRGGFPKAGHNFSPKEDHPKRWPNGFDVSGFCETCCESRSNWLFQTWVCLAISLFWCCCVGIWYFPCMIWCCFHPQLFQVLLAGPEEEGGTKTTRGTWSVDGFLAVQSGICLIWSPYTVEFAPEHWLNALCPSCFCQAF